MKHGHPSRIYHLRADAEHFSWLGVKSSRMRPLALILEGRPLRSEWVAPEVEQLVDDELPRGVLGDYPFLEGAPAVSKRAIDALLDLLAENVEFLPLRSDAGEYYVMNVTRVEDVLDESASQLTHFESSGRIKNIVSYAFRADRLTGLSVFKIPQTPRAPVFATESFKERARAAGLVGFTFDLVWDGTTGTRS